MELREILSRKPVKFLTLLLTAMLIATASAAVYYSLYMQTGATISQAAVQFVAGSDWNSSWSMGQNGTWCVLSIKAYPNATLTYQEPLNLTNNDSTTRQVKLVSSSVSPDNDPQVGNWSFINFTLVASNTSVIAEFDYTTTGNSWNEPSMATYEGIMAGETWAIKIETKAVEGAQEDLTVTLVIYVEIQE